MITGHNDSADSANCAIEIEIKLGYIDVNVLYPEDTAVVLV